MNFKSCIVAFIVQLSLSPMVLYGLTSDFSVSIESPCVPALVVFHNESSQGAGIKYLWDFGKGAVTFSDAEVLYENYADAGTYTIRLKVIQGTDTVQSSQLITLVDGPSAAISAEPTSGCLPQVVQFSDNSSPGDAPITSWFWDYRNGDTRNGNPVFYSYNEAGTYNVYLNITDANGCSDYVEAFDLVSIFDLPKVEFSASDSFACDAPLEVDFTNLSSGYGTLDYHWDFGNGQTSDNYEGTTVYSDGTYDVSLTVTDQHECTDSLSKESYITVGTASGSIYATQGMITYNTDGALICPGNITLHTTLPALPDMIWEIDYSGTVSFFEDVAEVSFLVPDAGSIDIMLRYNEASGCGDTLFRTFRIDHIVADFIMDTLFTCQFPVDVSMTNTSEGATGYFWLFPDGSTSHQTNVDHTFDTDESYSTEYTHRLQNMYFPVTLVATNANSCSDTMIRYMVVSLPVARFMPDVTSGCIPLEVTFSDSSKSSQPISKWTYLIEGEETVLSTSDPFSHTFSSPGNFDVRLIIENEPGCTDTSYRVTIRAGQKVDPWFSVDPVTLCPNDVLHLYDESADQGLIDTWQYSSPDLFNTGSIHQPDTLITIHPAESGPRDVYLVVESNGCAGDTVIHDAFTLESPSGYFDEHVECDSPFAYTFTAFTGGADNISWRVDGVIVPGTDTMKYVFPATGDYLVQMILGNSSSGCSITRSKIIPVRDVSAAFYVKPLACKNEMVSLDATSSVDYIEHCYVEGFLWDFDDDTPLRRNYSVIQEHAFSDTGRYTINLIVTADNGCTDTAEYTIEVVQPAADFSADPISGCGPDLDVDFSFYSYASTIDNWEWQFGDGVTDTSGQIDETHAYHSTVSRTFIAVLSVEDIYGCINQQTIPVELNVPTADFHAVDNTICLGDPAQFIIGTPGIISYTWDYGDETGPTTSGTHLYTDPGIYSVSLDIVVEGCEATVTRTGYISVELADAGFIVDDSVFTCYPATVTFHYTGTSSSIAQGIWTFQTGIQHPGFSQSVQYTYTEPGTYTASLTIITNNGCSATSSHVITVTGPTAEYSFTPVFMCSGDTVHFHIDELNEVEDFLWVFGDGDTSHLQNPEHVYTARGELYPSLILIQGECEVNLSDLPLYVSTINADFEFQPEQDHYCINAPIYARNLSEDYNSSVWKIDDNQVSTSTHLNAAFEHVGENVITLEVYNTLGCSDTMEVSAMVLEPSEFNITGDTSICRGNEATLQVDGQSGWTIHWEPEAWITNPEAFEIAVSPDTTAFITAIVTDGNGCVGTDSVLLYLEEPPGVQRIPIRDTSIFIGESIPLLVDVDDEGSEYHWSPDYHISCRNCNDPIVFPYENTTYTCHVIAGCLDDVLEFPVEVIIDFYLELPTAFSPNGDGINDIYGMEYHNVEEVDFRIFNRWGDLMFFTADPDEGWDGRSDGKLQNPDTYAYIIRAKSIHGYEFERKGMFILLR